MTKQNYTQLAILVDRSGSMSGLASDAEGGVKSLIKEQRELDGDLTVNLFQFDNEFEEVSEKEIDSWNLVPRGLTALRDAIGKSVTIVGERLAKLPEDERPDKVIFVITTDGLENTSVDWTQDAVKKLISEQTDKYGWQFIFTAANQDASLTGQQYGILATTSYDATGVGTRAMYGASSSAISTFRSGATQSVKVPEKV